MAKDWLDRDGAFKWGKHKGEDAEYVTRNDPEYVKWIVNECDDISDEDRDILSVYLERMGR